MVAGGVTGDMSYPEAPRVPRADGPDAVQLWVVAVLCFGAGDVVTTAIGLRVAGVVELQPVASYLFQHSPLGTMVLLKTAAFGSCYLLWKLAPEPYRIGVPLGLATFGTALVVWNLRVLLVATVP